MNEATTILRINRFIAFQDVLLVIKHIFIFNNHFYDIIFNFTLNNLAISQYDNLFCSSIIYNEAIIVLRALYKSFVFHKRLMHIVPDFTLLCISNIQNIPSGINKMITLTWVLITL